MTCLMSEAGSLIYPAMRNRKTCMRSMKRQTATYWTELAKCNQQEFQKSGTEGKGIEARELSAKLFEKETVRTIAEPSEGRMAQIIPQTDKTPKQEKITHKEPTDDLSTQQ